MNTYTKIKRAQVAFIIIVIVLFVLLIVLSTNGVEGPVLSVLAVFFLLSGIVQIPLGICRAKCKDKSTVRKSIKVKHVENQDQSTGYSAKQSRNQFDDFYDFVSVRFNNLPLPEYTVPQSFLDELRKEINNNKRPSVHTLQKIVIDMEHHLGCTNTNCIIFMEPKLGSTSGTFKNESYSFSELTVSYCDDYYAEQYLAIISHELSHAYQHNKNYVFPDNNFVEDFTDYLIAFLGFGKIYLNGMEMSRTFYEGQSTKTRSIKLGYLNKNHMNLAIKHAKLLSNKRYLDREERAKKEEIIKQILSYKEVYFSTISNIQNLLDSIRSITNISDEDFKYVQECTIESESTKNLDKITESKFSSLNSKDLNQLKKQLRLIENELTLLTIKQEKLMKIINK